MGTGTGEGGRHKPFDIGSLDDWRTQLHQYHDLKQWVHEAQRATLRGLPLGTQDPLAKRVAAFQRNREMHAIVGEVVSNRFLSLATAMMQSEEGAPHYITRALGEPQAAFGTHWHLVRAQIEVGRQLFGVEDPNVTLGPPPTNPHNEAWEQHYYQDIVTITQRMQLGQIMLTGTNGESDPHAIASEFGKSQIIDELGLPPTYPPRMVASLVYSGAPDAVEWLGRAHELLNSIEPPQAGLLIDQG